MKFKSNKAKVISALQDTYLKRWMLLAVFQCTAYAIIKLENGIITSSLGVPPIQTLKLRIILLIGGKLRQSTFKVLINEAEHLKIIFNLALKVND